MQDEVDFRFLICTNAPVVTNVIFPRIFHCLFPEF